ncbi:MAG TPA: hypothetical protein VN277_00090, partial [Acidiferrobacterales bacterium]|nr:hypothetical protein [Acidiferrobacterales bacterium]
MASIFDEVAPMTAEEAAQMKSSGALTQDMNTPITVSTLSNDSSILSEALPSETAGEFIETRLPGTADGAAAGTGLPLIGGLPQAGQQRILFFMVLGGAFALLLGGYLAISAANRSASHVGAVGTAMMQSQ